MSDDGTFSASSDTSRPTRWNRSEAVIPNLGRFAASPLEFEGCMSWSFFSERRARSGCRKPAFRRSSQSQNQT